MNRNTADITITPEATQSFSNAIKNANEIWTVVGRGGLCFRYGPYTSDEVGPMMHKAVEKGIGMTFIIQCGKTVDWEYLAELAPADRTAKNG